MLTNYKDWLLNESVKNLYQEYAQKVGWVMQSKDIRSTSGNVNAREKRLNLGAKTTLFQNFSSKEDFDDEKVKVPGDIPILYYGGSADKESEQFMKNKQINKKNLYNQREILLNSGDKVKFGKLFGEFEWLPKHVYSKKEAVDGAVGFPVIAKVKNGHSGLGVMKFDTAKELEKDDHEFDLFSQFIDFEREFRVVFCRDRVFIINERVPNAEADKSIRTKKADEKVQFVYVYQDLNKVPKKFMDDVKQICSDIKPKLDLDLWSLDVVMDKKGKLWVMETSSATGLGSVKMCEVYRAIYEDFYKEKLPDEFLEDMYKKWVVTGHQNYWPSRKKEIESSPWAMDYTIITDPDHKDGYRYFFNLD